MLRYYALSLWYIINRWIFRTRFMVAYTPQFDLKFKFRTPDVMGRLIYKRGMHEVDNTRFLLSYLDFQDEDIWFDIGANIGWFSLVLSKRMAPNTTVYAFEPDPLNYELLQENVRMNNAISVVCVNKALSDRDETMTLYRYPSKNLGRHSLLPLNDEQGVPVQTTSLDQFVQTQNLAPDRVKFIKMDIEGYEYVALCGARTLLNHVPYLLCEFSPDYMKKGGIDARDLLALMEEYRYVPHTDFGGTLTRISYQDTLKFTSNVNIFWIKEGYGK